MHYLATLLLFVATTTNAAISHIHTYIYVCACSLILVVVFFYMFPQYDGNKPGESTVLLRYMNVAKREDTGARVFASYQEGDV